MSNDPKSASLNLAETFAKINESQQNSFQKAMETRVINEDHMKEIYKARERLNNPVMDIADTLKKQIKLFESKLNQDEDVMIMAASFGSAVIFYVHAIEFNNPNIIIFHGSDENGNDISLLQHCNQLNFLLQVGKREQPEQPKRQIGFVIND